MKSSIHENLKIFRKINNLSQKQVADHLCISQPAYARIENGKSNSWSSYLQKISTLYKIKPEDLLKKDCLDIISNTRRKKNTLENTIKELQEVYDVFSQQYRAKLNELKKLNIELNQK